MHQNIVGAGSAFYNKIDNLCCWMNEEPLMKDAYAQTISIPRDKMPQSVYFLTAEEYPSSAGQLSPVVKTFVIES